MRCEDDHGSFDVTRLDPAEAPSTLVLFAVGGGGDPERHRPLLESLVDRGCAVVAPHFDRFLSPAVSEETLLLRARRLRAALDAMQLPDATVVGVGHSIGATMLLALAGAQLWMRTGTKVLVDPEPRITRLALLAPATGYFRAPAALDAVQIPIFAWAGERDVMTPPADVLFLREAMAGRIPVDVRVAPEAAHFSFMNVMPPNVPDEMANRAGFLSQLTREVGAAVVGRG